MTGARAARDLRRDGSEAARRRTDSTLPPRQARDLVHQRPRRRHDDRKRSGREQVEITAAVVASGNSSVFRRAARRRRQRLGCRIRVMPDALAQSLGQSRRIG
jgi:hypothetical protein